MTNKLVLYKGIRYLAFALPLLFLGPVFLNSCFKNEGHPLFPYLLVLAILVCVYAVYLGFKGVKTIVSSMFDK